LRVHAVDDLDAATSDGAEGGPQLDGAERRSQQDAEQAHSGQHQQGRGPGDERRRSRSVFKAERCSDREDEHGGEEPEGVPHRRVVAKQVQAGGEHRVVPLHHQEQQRVHDPQQRQHARRDGEQHLRRLVGRDRANLDSGSSVPSTAAAAM
jgi:hypothetical protein